MEITIDGHEVVIGRRKGSHGVRYSWFCSQVGIGGEGTFTTEDLAIADATATLAGGECAHGAPRGQFCPTCHDREI